MSTKGKWATPHGVVWSSNNGHGNSYVTTNRLLIRNSTVSYFGFYSEYRTFQIQWRLRKRLGPLNTAINDRTIEPEQWTQWSQWQGMTNDVANIDMGGALKQLCAYQTPISFDYDFSLYDKMEYEVRVRAFDEPSLTHSEWCYGTLPVCYAPTFKVIAAKVDHNGDLVVSYSTNWQRGGNRVQRGTVYCNGAPLGVSDWSETPNMPAPNGSFVVNKSQFGTLSNGQKILIRGCTFYTVDNVSAGYIENVVAVVGTEAPSGEASPPVVREYVNECDKSVTVCISKPADMASEYTSARVVITWVDKDGDTRTIEPDRIVASSGTWTALFSSPPLDVRLEIKAAGINSFGTAASSKTITVDSGGRHYWSDTDGTIAVLAYNQSVSYSFERNMVSSDLLAGRSRPVAFFGVGGVETVQVSGVILENNVAPAHSSHVNFEKLKSSGIIRFRAPSGIIMDASVPTISITPNGYNMWAVSMTLKEV